MSESAVTMLRDTAGQIFEDLVTPELLREAETGVFPQKCWDAVAEAGLHQALIPEEAGGFGLAADEALSLLRVAGEHALPLPLAETMLATWLLAGAGLAIPDGVLSIANGPDLTLSRDGTVWRLRGSVRNVAWGRHADAIAVLAEVGGAAHIALLSKGQFTATAGENMAREPRDTLTVDAVLPASAVAPAAAGIGAAQFRAAGAVTRALLMSGGLVRIGSLAAQYTMDRVQFGKPLAKQQVIQQNMAIVATHSAASMSASDIGADAFANGMKMLGVAAAKIRTGEAVGVATNIVHQTFGAIGFTYEHRLHFYTKRLWSWRNEYGTETEWSVLLGRYMAAAGSDRFWAELTDAA